MRIFARLGLIAGLMLGLSSACGGTDDGSAPDRCVPGESRSCTGCAARSGYQVCNADARSFAACVCVARKGNTAGAMAPAPTDQLPWPTLQRPFEAGN
ncbi:MAG: hypothetical protein R3B13_37535 [Polyangiaceae bacterium]